jgi:hypothetical protein
MMRILFGTAAVAFVIGVAGSAYAAEATGVVNSLNSANDMVTLVNDTTSNLAKGVTFPNYTVGEQLVEHLSPLGQRLPGC